MMILPPQVRESIQSLIFLLLFFAFMISSTMKVSPPHFSKQSYKEYQKQMSKMIKVLIKLLDVLETHTVQKKENLSFMLAAQTRSMWNSSAPFIPLVI
jgi:hypothetical protein